MLDPFSRQESFQIIFQKFLARVCLETCLVAGVCVFEELLKVCENLLSRLIPDWNCQCPLAEEVIDCHEEFGALVVATQCVPVRHIRLPLRIDPLIIGLAAFEVRSCWFEEGVTLLTCKEVLHTAARDTLYACLLFAAEEPTLHRKQDLRRVVQVLE